MAKVLTPARRARLDKLATYLEALPADYSHFNMNLYVDTVGGSEKSEAEYARTNGGVQTCGTAACAAGHGPSAGVLVPPRFIRGNSVDWHGYSRDLFTGTAGRGWSWCFGGLWGDIDNHHYGAAARIRYLLDQRSAPDDYEVAEEEWVPLYAPYRIDAKANADA